MKHTFLCLVFIIACLASATVAYDALTRPINSPFDDAAQADPHSAQSQAEYHALDESHRIEALRCVSSREGGFLSGLEGEPTDDWRFSAL